MKKLFGIAFVVCCAFCCSAAVQTVFDDDFSTNAAGENVPGGWNVYRSGPTVGKISIRENGGAKELVLKDVCEKSEIGITRRLTAIPGKYYRLSADIGPSAAGFGRIPPSLQLRFLSQPNKVNNVRLEPGKTFVVTGQANAAQLQLYIFTMKPGMPEVTVKRVKLEVSDKPF